MIEQKINDAVVLSPILLGAYIDDATYELEEASPRIARAYTCFYLHNHAYVPWTYLQAHYGIQEHKNWPQQVKEMVMTSVSDGHFMERLKCLGANFYELGKNTPLYSITSAHLEMGLIWKAAKELNMQVTKPQVIMAIQARNLSAEEILERFYIGEL